MNPSSSQNGSIDKLFIPSQGLLNIFRSIGATGNCFTIKQILGLLSFYTRKKGLLKENPGGSVVIKCELDALEQVFGVKEFELKNLWLYLRKNLFAQPKSKDGDSASTCNEVTKESNGAHDEVDGPQNKNNGARGSVDEVDGPQNRNNGARGSFDEVDGLKRKNDELYLEEQKEKKGKFAFAPKDHMTLIITKSDPYDSSPESPLSVQGYETSEGTHPLKDGESSDSSEETWEVEEDIFSVEYEVESLASDNESIPSNGDSDTENFIIQGIVDSIGICQTDGDVAFWADISSEDELSSDSDSEFTFGCGLSSRLKDSLLSEKWECLKCNSFNNQSTLFCSKCWQPRGRWALEHSLPQHRRAPRHRRNKLHGPSYEKTSQPLLSEAFDETDSAGWTISSQDSSQGDNGLLVLKQDNSHMCTICHVRPRTGIIVHGDTGHQVCCYLCARKLAQKSDPRCPVCRRTIKCVIRNFVA